MKKLFFILLFIPFISFGQNISEKDLIEYFDNASYLSPIEGIWILKFPNNANESVGKFVVMKDSNKRYNGFYIEFYNKDVADYFKSMGLEFGDVTNVFDELDNENYFIGKSTIESLVFDVVIKNNVVEATWNNEDGKVKQVGLRIYPK